MDVDRSPTGSPALRPCRGAYEYPTLVGIWRSAVDATHDFLADADRDAIESALAAEYFPQVQLTVAELGGVSVGFAGTNERNLEMLFVDAAVRGMVSEVFCWTMSWPFTASAGWMSMSRTPRQWRSTVAAVSLSLAETTTTTPDVRTRSSTCHGQLHTDCRRGTPVMISAAQHVLLYRCKGWQ